MRDAFADMPLPQQRVVGVLEVVGKLKAGVSRSAAAEAMSSVANALQEQHNPGGKAYAVVVTPFTEVVLGRLGARLWIALGMAGAVLLFACANVAALRLALLRERSGELVARLCLGASSGTLCRQLLAETTPLLVLSAGGSLIIGAAGEAWLRHVPVVASSGIDLTQHRTLSIAATAGFTFVSWILVSAAPACTAVRRTTLAGVPSSSRTSVRGSRSAGALLLTQSALAICLVAMAGGAFRAFTRLGDADVGFATAGVTALDVAVPQWKYGTANDRHVLDARLLTTLGGLPGVTAAAGVSVRPFRFGEIADGIPVRRPEDVTMNLTDAIGASRVVVTPEYFRAMDIAIESGRAFTDADRGAKPSVAVVSRTLARMLWGGAPAVGRELESGTAGGWQRHLVVGVAEDVRSRVIHRPALEVYVPHGRGGLPLGSYVLKHASGAISEPVIRAALNRVDPDLALERLQSTRAVVDGVIAPSRLLSTAMTMLSGSGLVLLALGIFGAAATTLRAARGEVAIRQAVGATPLRAARAPLRNLIIAISSGVALGVAIAPGALGLLASMGVADTSGLMETLGVAGLAVTGAAATAIGLTLRPAMRVSPAELLRAE